MAVTVLIAEDEALARDRLLRLLADLPDYEVVAEAQDGSEALAEATRHSPDIVLLDIQMPEVDGLAVAKQLATLDTPPAIIFCTAYEEHAVDAFDVQAAGYLLKPIRKEKLIEVLERAKRVNRYQQAENPVKTIEEEDRKPQRSHISARTYQGLIVVPVDDIRYFRADQKYVTVGYSEGEVLIDESLKQLHEEFEQRFLRVHRNALVATKYLLRLESSPDDQGHYVVVSGSETRLLVSRRHLSKVRKVMRNLSTY